MSEDNEDTQDKKRKLNIEGILRAHQRPDEGADPMTETAQSRKNLFERFMKSIHPEKGVETTDPASESPKTRRKPR